MADTQVKVTPPASAGRKILRRTLSILILALFLGFGMRHASAALDRSPNPAGFLRGMLQGALMPCALPNLLVGNDVVIYAANNTGVGYKLGYTCGVNACGALFFGLFFWRVNRWRKRMSGEGTRAVPAQR
jgi:hypothetical protein